jgi:hypothetical protein
MAKKARIPLKKTAPPTQAQALALADTPTSQPAKK